MFLSTGLATNDSANYREAAAPCKPAAKAAVGSQASAVPKVYACRKLFAFARKCRSFVRSFVHPGLRYDETYPARISARGSVPEAVACFFTSCLLFFHRSLVTFQY